MSYVHNVAVITSSGDATAMSDVGHVAVTTGVGEVGTGTSVGDMTALSDVRRRRTQALVT